MNIGVFFGSRSPEHDVSIITAQLIISGLKGLGYTVIPVYISQKGEWLIGEELGSLKNFTDPASSTLKNSKFKQYYIDLEKTNSKLVFKPKGLLAKKELVIDLAFPALHGSYGEDGTIQGLFEMFNVPYVGCDVPSSAIAMDKVLTKQMYKQHGVATTKFIYFEQPEWEQDKEKIIQRIRQELTWPVFVKPARLGSSVGIAKIKEKEGKDLEFRLEVALHYDSKVIVEESVENLMDVTCCVIGNGEPIPSLLQESVFQSDLFDFEEKYLKDGGAQLGKSQSGLVIPARLDAETTQAIQKAAITAYKIFGCSGIARVDFLYNKITRDFFANEINPLPGTMYHHLWKASGIEFDALLKKLIQYAEEKHRQKQKVTYTFESKLLHQLNSTKLQSRKLNKP